MDMDERQRAEDSRERIDAAQEIATSTIGGTVYGRIRYGHEGDDAADGERDCRDCGVHKGQFHVPACCVEQCPCCYGQAITCDCFTIPATSPAMSSKTGAQKAANV